VPKSGDEARMTANISLSILTEDHMRAIDAIHFQPGMHKSLFDVSPPEGTVFGWPYEWLGWKMVQGGVVKAH